MENVNAAQIAQVKANCTTFRSAQQRQVQGGYVVSGMTQYQDRDTKGMVLQENAEGVAATVEEAVNMTGCFLRHGSFDEPAPEPAPAPLFPELNTQSVI